MMRRHPRSIAVIVVALAAVLLVPGCPTIKIRSLEVASFRKDVAVFDIQVEVDNSANDAGSNSSKLAVALPTGWEVVDLTYHVPGEVLQRRAQPLPGVAIQADWVYERDDAVWWGYTTAEHAVPAGKHIYPVQLTVRVPKKTKTGWVALAIGDPGPDAEVGAFTVELKGKREVDVIAAPAVNPDSQLAAAGDAGSLEGMMAGLGEGLAALGEGLEGVGEAGSMMRTLGTMLGVDTGAEGYREEWISTRTEEGVFRMGGVALAIPADWSAMGDEPADATVQMVLMPPGGSTFLGLKVVPAVGAEGAPGLFEEEVGKAANELAAEGTPAAISEIARTTPGGKALKGRQLRVIADGSESLWTMVRVDGIDHLAMVVTSGDAATVEAAIPRIDELLDAVGFE